MKKARPSARITVHERNRPDDTFGFGVVFSDQTLETFEKYDRESYRAITENFAYWDDIAIHYKDASFRIGATGSAAAPGARCCCCCRSAPANSASRCTSRPRFRASSNSPTQT